MTKLALYLIGYSEHIKLEYRIFNAMCIIGLFISGYSIPYSYIIGLKTTALIFSILFFALLGVYYLARFKQKSKLGILIASTLLIILLTLNYFYGNGIKGSSLLSFSLSFFLLMIVSSGRQYWIWTCIYLLAGLFLLILEFKYPYLISSEHASKPTIFFDIANAYVVHILTIVVGLYYVKSAYYKERKTVKDKALLLEQLNTEKTKFFSILSHDLRSPLNSIKHYIELIKDKSFSETEREGIEKKLSESVTGTLSMLDNLLSWSKSQLKDGSAELNEYKVEDILSPVIKNQTLVAKDKGITLNCISEPSLTVCCDLNMLKLVVRNLVGNAIKFTPSGGSVTVSAAAIQNICTISVKDNGQGIRPEDHEKIFSLQASSTYGTANEKGIGLGLYLCHDYTLSQKGKIWFESKVNEGSTFFVALPLKAELA